MFKHPCYGQLTALKTGYLLTRANDRIAGSVANSSRSRVFKFSADQLLAFN